MRIALAILSIVAFCANALFGFMVFAVSMQMGAFSMPTPWWIKAAAITLVIIPIIQAVIGWRGAVFQLRRAGALSCAAILGLFAISIAIEMLLVR